MTVTDQVDPKNYSTVSKFKRTVYDEISDSGVPSLLLDMKLGIIYKKAHGQELLESEKKLLGGEEFPGEEE